MKKNIKLLVSIISLMVLSSMVLMADDLVIQASQLPANAQSFIKKNFPSDTIVYAERDRNSFKAELSSGVEIEFLANGDWKDVSSRMPLPTTFIPANVVKAVQGKYPQVAIMEVSKEYNSYQLKLANRMEVYVDNNGNIMGEKLD